MSKELEALENMRADIIDFRDIIENSSYSTDEDYEIVKQALKRNKLMKVEVLEYDNILGFQKGHCPNCANNVYRHFRVGVIVSLADGLFCSTCGQKLDWSK